MKNSRPNIDRHYGLTNSNSSCIVTSKSNDPRSSSVTQSCNSDDKTPTKERKGEETSRQVDQHDVDPGRIWAASLTNVTCCAFNAVFRTQTGATASSAALELLSSSLKRQQTDPQAVRVDSSHAQRRNQTSQDNRLTCRPQP